MLGILKNSTEKEKEKPSNSIDKIRKTVQFSEDVNHEPAKDSSE